MVNSSSSPLALFVSNLQGNTYRNVCSSLELNMTSFITFSKPEYAIIATGLITLVRFARAARVVLSALPRRTMMEKHVSLRTSHLVVSIVKKITFLRLNIQPY